MENRISTLSALLPEDIDAALIISETNRRYLTDFVSSLGYLFVTKSGAVLLVDSRYEEAAAKKARNCTVLPFRKLSDSIGAVIRQYGLSRILLEGSAFTLNEAARIEEIMQNTGAQAVKTDRLDRILNRMRIIKTSEEIEKMRRAQRLTEDAFSQTLLLIKEGVTERELALELEFRMRRAGADGAAFDLIVLTGANTSMPHGVPSHTKVENGHFILFDIGATVDGYHSDMTRTVILGKPDAVQKRVYQTVQQAQQRTLDAIREGVTCHQVDEAARSYIDSAGFEGSFGHSTGHGVGLAIHESPSVSPQNDFVLHSGMVITAEPGIYLPGKCGVRIEDMVVVSGDGCINLAALPKNLIEL